MSLHHSADVNRACPIPESCPVAVEVYGGQRAAFKLSRDVEEDWHLTVKNTCTVGGSNGTRLSKQRVPYYKKLTSGMAKRGHGCIEKEMGTTLGMQCKTNGTVQQTKLSGY
ncbi:hypothetical protein T4C_4687 [Trichinella pseudospiralis]|uniref:Uncharacterized protein n=2 Tax=Trichinella pseudospiralis TaxID=6337 RepID=A0A0V1ISB6_TRIPS|nr:hypothetical protein T4C_4687 [Trichinella pseudospiralis]